MESNILRRLGKLRQMAELGSGPEQANAVYLIKVMMEKYNLTDIEMEEKRDFPIKIHGGMKDATIQMAHGLGYQVRYYIGKTNRLFVYCTQTEHEIFEDCLDDLKAMYNGMYTKAMNKIKAHMAGFASRSYPSAEPSCPDCEKELDFDYIDKRYFCPCGYRGKKICLRNYDDESYKNGAREARKLLK